MRRATHHVVFMCGGYGGHVLRHVIEVVASYEPAVPSGREALGHAKVGVQVESLPAVVEKRGTGQPVESIDHKHRLAGVWLPHRRYHFGREALATAVASSHLEVVNHARLNVEREARPVYARTIVDPPFPTDLYTI